MRLEAMNKMNETFNERYSYIFTGICDSVNRGGSASVHAGMPPPGADPPRSRLPPPREQTPPPEQTQRAGGTHPTIMHSCWKIPPSWKYTFWGPKNNPEKSIIFHSNFRFWEPDSIRRKERISRYDTSSTRTQTSISQTEFSKKWLAF